MLDRHPLVDHLGKLDQRFFTGVLFIFFWFQPQSDKISALLKQKGGLSQELKKAKATAANRPKLQAELDATETLFNETATLLPKEKEIPSLLTNISALGRGSGLDFLTFKPLADIPKDFYSEIPVDIQVRGPYHNMGIFLDQVSKLDRIVAVSNINMGGPAQVSGEMLLNSSCRLVTYRFTNQQVSKPEDKNKKGKR